MSGHRASKRHCGEKPEVSSSSELGFECLPLSPSQLRQIWNYDNECGRIFMGAPQRSCSSSSSEEDDTTGSLGGISHPEFENLKIIIKDMWQKAASIFEIYHDKKQPELGFRIRVKQSMPLKITLKTNDDFFFGWCAIVPEDSPSSHVYNRSPVRPKGYMGGPASFCNWASGKSMTVMIMRPTRRSSRYLARLECRNLSAGTELVWNYGYEKEMPHHDLWFKECCSVLSLPTIRQENKRDFRSFINTEKCVLCGYSYSIENKDNRLQRKPHFINNHADFLGSEWAGFNAYNQEEIDALKVLSAADKLNELIQTLRKDLKWNVIPACTVISSEEKKSYGSDNQALLIEFQKRCSMLRNTGTLVLRGETPVDKISDLHAGHLDPIPPSVWRTLNWSSKGPPLRGLYAVPQDHQDEQKSLVQSSVLNFCINYFASW